tara:strand:- start:11789 stop:11989 length:201 start_codon:yes stop_codon:yes gene_type:complete
MTDFITTTDFGFLREKAGLSIPEVAQLMGVANPAISATYGIFASLAFGLLGLWFTRGEARVHGDDR